jgi:hypothetical protein
MLTLICHLSTLSINAPVVPSPTMLYLPNSIVTVSRTSSMFLLPDTATTHPPPPRPSSATSIAHLPSLLPLALITSSSRYCCSPYHCHSSPSLLPLPLIITAILPHHCSLSPLTSSSPYCSYTHITDPLPVPIIVPVPNALILLVKKFMFIFTKNRQTASLTNDH